MKVTNKMQLYRLIYYSLSALRVSVDIFAHHKEHMTVFTASDSIHSGHCLLVSWVSSDSSMTPAGSDVGKYYQMLSIQSSAPDDGRKHSPKHVELTRNNKLTYKLAPCWLLS